MIASTFSLPLFLERVRGRQKLERDQIRHFIMNVSTYPAEQVGAFLAHAFHQPLGKENMVDLTLAMRDSGTCLNWKGLDKPVVDKHSTGGVGDKISICLAPMLAALDLAVPMISGRGLGFTGGTLDKLESIPGFKTNLSPDTIMKQTRTLGLAFGQQTADIAPADARLYALRDITATVESIPLITASILSKKLAESLGFLILDVKWGTGAFMSTLESARELARSLTEISNGAGTKTRALLTNMNQPLGIVSGNWCEIAEAVHILKNDLEGDERPDDTYKLTLEQAAHLLVMTKKAKSLEEGRKKAEATLTSGRAFEIFCQVVTAQGGDVKHFEKNFALIPRTKINARIQAPHNGTIQSIQTRQLGQALVLARAGRQRKEDSVDPHVTLYHPYKVGDVLQKDQVVCELTLNDGTFLPEIKRLLETAFVWGDAPAQPQPLVQEVIE